MTMSADVTRLVRKSTRNRASVSTAGLRTVIGQQAASVTGPWSDTDPASTSRARIGTLDFAVTDLASAVRWTTEGARRNPACGRRIHLANAYCVSIAGKDHRYRAIMTEQCTNFPDGMPVAWVMRWRGNREAQRVRGPSYFEAVLDQGRTQNLRHFFIGSTENTLQLMCDRLLEQYPGIHIAGHYSPPFAPLSDDFYDACTAAVTAADADIVWVGLGTPKQDYVAAVVSRRTGRDCICVGAAFDLTAGTLSVPPAWMQSSGLEWVYRLAAEPRRLWRRYLFGNIGFIMAVLRQTRRANDEPRATALIRTSDRARASGE